MNQKYPAFIEEKLAQLKQKGGTYIHHDNEYTYVLLALGERPTGGYSIEVVAAEERPSGNEVLVKAKERRPHPSDIVIQVLTYPVAVYRLPRTDLPVKVEWVRSSR